MKDNTAIWRERAWRWAIPVALVVLALVGVIFFQTAFSGRVEALLDDYGRQAEVLDDLRKERLRAESFLEGADDQDDAARYLREEHFATEGERFTRVLREIRALARTAGMNPLSFAYPEQSVEEYGLTRRIINFSVDGSYESLRSFINLLEQTGQFIILDSVSLTGGDERTKMLSIQLSLSTIFLMGETVYENQGLERPLGASEGLTSSTAPDGPPLGTADDVPIERIELPAETLVEDEET